MFKIYQKYIINNFIIKFLYICLVFATLTFILNILEEISFLKDLDVKNLVSIFFNIIKFTNYNI